MEYLENRTFDEIAIGDRASVVRTLTEADIDLFAVMSGDVNPAHVDPEYARSDLFHKIIAHGMWGGALISAVLGTMLPGPGTIYLKQELQFRAPVGLGDTITASVTAAAKDAERHHITFDCACTNQRGEVVIAGTALVIAPTEKVKRPRAVLPNVYLFDRGARLRRLIELTHGREPIQVAVVHPVDRAALLWALDAATAGLVVPTFVGPEARIRAAAEALSVDLSPYTLVATEHSTAAAERAVALAREHKVEALMEGSLAADELMKAALAPNVGLRTGRRMSHVWLLDVPTYVRPLLLTDALLNVYPDLQAKRDIVQNAIDLAHVLGIAAPNVAILSATQTVTPALRSTLDAAALSKMVDRGQIAGGAVDGPLAFDTAVSPEAARAAGVNSPVAGQADILVAPDLESGTMLVKQLEYLAEAQASGVVLGARVPILLNGRAGDSLSHLASCAVALLLVHSRRQSRPAESGSTEAPVGAVR